MSGIFAILRSLEHEFEELCRDISDLARDLWRFSLTESFKRSQSSVKMVSDMSKLRSQNIKTR